jgi:hypothetical protein
LEHDPENDQWWIDFAELAEDRVEGTSAQERELREAIHIARRVLVDYQRSSEHHSWMRSTLIEVGIPIHEAMSAARYPLDANLS